MADRFAKFQPGTRIPSLSAGFLNALVDLLNQGGSRAGELPFSMRQSVVRIRNDAGATTDRFAVFGLSDPVFTPTDNADEFANHPIWKAINPKSIHQRDFVISLEPLKSGEVGWAALTGIVHGLTVNVPNEAWQYATIEKDTRTRLVACPCPSRAKILWKESGTGDKKAAVLLGAAPPMIEVYNDYNGELPAYGIAPITAFSGAGRTLSRLGTTWLWDFVVNGPVPLAYQESGLAQAGPDVIALHDGTSPTVGQTAGPLENSFKAKVGQPGLLLAAGEVDATLDLFRATLHRIDRLLVKVTADVAAGADSGGSPTTTTDYNIYVGTATASGFSGTKPTAYNYGPAIPTGRWARLTRWNNHALIEPLQCA